MFCFAFCWVVFCHVFLFVLFWFFFNMKHFQHHSQYSSPLINLPIPVNNFYLRKQIFMTCSSKHREDSRSHSFPCFPLATPTYTFFSIPLTTPIYSPPLTEAQPNSPPFPNNSPISSFVSSNSFPKRTLFRGQFSSSADSHSVYPNNANSPIKIFQFPSAPSLSFSISPTKVLSYP